jgi:hypothetical protein
LDPLGVTPRFWCVSVAHIPHETKRGKKVAAARKEEEEEEEEECNSI